jgi:hypothetical protein
MTSRVAAKQDPLTQPDNPVSLPSEHLIHADVFSNELNIRLAGFEAGIIALQGELEGQQQAHEAQVAELTKKHETAKAGLLKRIEDMQRGKRMAAAALDEAGRDATA